MPRPTEFVDLKQTSVTVERALLEEAKNQKINISKILREALQNELGEVELKKPGPLKKFKGLPLHLVKEAQRKAIHIALSNEKIAEWFNMRAHAHVTAKDIDALVPRF